MRKRLTLCIALIVMTFFTVLAKRPPIDDAYITFRYAYNLANHLSFTYNPGEYVLGTTSPLWAALLSIPEFFNAGCESLAVYGGAISLTIVTALFFIHLANSYSLLVQILWGAAILFYYPLHTVAFSGLESGFSILIVALGLFSFRSERFLLGSLFATAATLLRPDGVLVIVAGSIAALVAKSSFSRIARGVALYGICLTPFLLVLYFFFGEALPHSIAAKRVLYPVSIGKNTLYFFEALSQTPLDAILLCIGGAGLVLSIRDSTVRVFGIWALLYSVGLIASGVKPIFFWYFGPLWMLFSTVGIYTAIKQIHLPALVMKSSVAALLALMIFDTVARERAVDRVLIREDGYRQVVRDFRSQIGSSRVLVGETGVLGYGLPQAKIIDSAGICSRETYEINKELREKIGRSGDLQRDTDWAKRQIEELSPDWRIGSVGRMQLGVIEGEEWFNGRYEKVALYSAEELGGVGVYRVKGLIPY